MAAPEGGPADRVLGAAKGLAVLSIMVLATVLAASASGAAATPVERGGLGEKIDAYMGRVREDRGFSGSVLVAKDGGVVLNRGYGLADAATGTPVTAGTIFGVASLAKQFTAAAILKLEEQGKLSVEDPISEHLDGVPPDKAGITIRQLLTHTSGLSKNHSTGDLQRMDREQALEAICAKPLESKPGSTYSYSDSGYTLLAATVEKVSGESFEDYVRENLFEPAGLRRTGFWNEPKFDRLPVAHGYVNGEAQGSPAGFPGPTWAILGAGGILSTTDDLYKWWEALSNHEILTRAGTDKLFTPYVKESGGAHYGYGWDIQQTDLGRMVTHNGAGNTGNAILAAYPRRDLVIVVLSNRVTYRSLTFGGLVDDDKLPYQVGLPADETAERLAESVERGDFSEMPPPTLPLWLTLGALGVIAAVVLGAAALAYRLVKRLSRKNEKSAAEAR